MKFLLGLLSAFENRFQAVADNAMKEISWKQFFAIICINLCKSNPTVKELAEIMGSSHQNVKQILLKSEKKCFVNITVDEKDNKEWRIKRWEKARIFYCPGGFNYEKMSASSKLMMKMFVSALRAKKDKTEEDEVMIEMISKSYDISDKKYIEPIVEWAKAVK